MPYNNMKKISRLDIYIVDQHVERILEGNNELSGSTTSIILSESLSLTSHNKDISNWYSMLLKDQTGPDTQEHRYSILENYVNNIAKSLSNLGFGVAELFFRLDSQGLVGSGGGVFKPIFEVGLTVDPVLGVPYYPGSGIKGAVRSLTSELYGEDVEKILFGHSAGEKGSAGHAFFSDMYPVGCSRDECSIFRGLVVNPHYYRGGEPVEDELQVKTNPVVHIGVSEGLVFGLVIGTRPVSDKSRRKKLAEMLQNPRFGDDNDMEVPGIIKKLASSDNLDLTTIISLLTMETLSKGIAARSNKGYNVFTPVETFNHQFRIVGYRIRTSSTRGGRSG